MSGNCYGTRVYDANGRVDCLGMVMVAIVVGIVGTVEVVVLVVVVVVVV